MNIGINCGHTLKGPGCGASGLIKESWHTRLTGYSLMKKLREAGIKVTDCTIDQAVSRQQYLEAAVKAANRKNLDWFISIHFNASAAHTGHGTEVYTYAGRQYPEALEVCANLAALGFTNRGVKAGSGLYVIRKTKAKSMLIEVCFCDNPEDVELYRRSGAENAVAQAIYDAILHRTTNHAPEILEEKSGEAQREALRADRNAFIEYTGGIACRDWQKRHIILPSVTVAQAMKESACGTSELARKANALFGIKENGWTGRTYVKTATEQRADGSCYTVENTVWRAYDSWEQSILDHNDYIATRSTDGGRTLRYGPVIGCASYILVCQYLQECGYATSVNYAESLISDYVEKYHLMRFDEPKEACSFP